jgi:hypothetical protein
MLSVGVVLLLLALGLGLAAAISISRTVRSSTNSAVVFVAICVLQHFGGIVVVTSACDLFMMQMLVDLWNWEGQEATWLTSRHYFGHAKRRPETFTKRNGRERMNNEVGTESRDEQ